MGNLQGLHGDGVTLGEVGELRERSIVGGRLRIEDGQREAYREEHQNVPAALEEAYLESGASLETYSVFEKTATCSAT